MFKHDLNRQSARLQINAAYIADTIEAEISLNKSKIDQISLLVSRRHELVDRVGTGAEIADIDSKIDALKSTLGRENIPSIENLEQTTIKKGGLPPGDVRRLLGLPSSSGGESDGGSDRSSSPSLSSSPALRQAVAGAVPRSLMMQASFWQRQRSFVCLVIASVVAGYILLPYTSGSDGNGEFLSVIVLLLAVPGFYLTAKMLAQLDVETALVIEVEARAADYLRDVKTKQRARIDLDRLEETLLPNNPAEPPPPR
ncbi:MAG: hypothetical protein QM757_38320 [Paludibaculum sp.]